MRVESFKLPKFIRASALRKHTRFVIDMVAGACPKIVDKEIWSKDFGGGMEAFQDQLMPADSRSVEKPSMEDLNDDIVKAVGSQGHWKECCRVEAGEDGAEDLGLLSFASLGV